MPIQRAKVSEIREPITYTCTAVRRRLLNDTGCPGLANEVGKDALMRPDQFVVVRLLGIRFIVGRMGGQRQLTEVACRVVRILLVRANAVHVIQFAGRLAGEELAKMLNLPEVDLVNAHVLDEGALRTAPLVLPLLGEGPLVRERAPFPPFSIQDIRSPHTCRMQPARPTLMTARPLRRQSSCPCRSWERSEVKVPRVPMPECPYYPTICKFGML